MSGVGAMIACSALAFAQASNGALAEADLANLAALEFHKGVEQREAKERAIVHFRAAAKYWQELQRRGVANPALYLNLGNALLLSGDVPGAIVSYHRGLKLEYTNQSLHRAIEAAREQVNFPIEGALGRQISREATPLHTLNSGQFFAIGFALYVAMCFRLMRGRIIGHRGHQAAALAYLGLAGFAAIAGIRRADVERSYVLTKVAVVTRDGERLRKGDGWLSPGEPAFPPRYPTPLPAGVEMRVIRDARRWLQVELSGGEMGWVPASSVEVVN